MRRTAPTLSDTLAVTRLTHRRVRLDLVLAALHERVADVERRGDPVPAPLRAAIAGFEEELAQVRRRLHELRGGPGADTRRPRRDDMGAAAA